MRVGVGLPNAIPGTGADALVEWTRRADEGPFTSVGVVERIRYDCYEPMTTLAMAAGATARVRLAATVVVGPLRNTAVLAKEAATVDAVSGGRLTLGLAVGARKDDYDAAEVDPRGRGRRLSDQLFALRSLWEDDNVGPRPARPQGPELLVGGTSDMAFARAARFADGYVHGGGPPRAFERAAAKARAAWIDAGRPGRPALWGQGYYALGDDAADDGVAYIKDYYSFTGPFADRIAAALLTTRQDVVQFLRGYEEAGCDEIVLLPAVADIEQLDRLADVVTGL